MHHANISTHRRDARSLILTQGGPDRPPFVGMGPRFLRFVTGVVIAALVNLSLAPLVSASQIKRSQAATLKATTSDEQSYANALRGIHEQASRPVNPLARAPAPDLGNPDTLQSYADNIQAQWQSASVDAAIIERQRAMEQAFAKRHEQLMALLRAAKAPAAGAAQRQALADFLGEEQPKPTHLPINLNNMPWQVQTPTQAEPAATAQALQQKMRLPQFQAKAAPEAR